MSLKDIDTGIKKIKSMLISDMEKQLKLLGIGYEKIYSFEEINDIFDINRKYKRKQVLDVLMNECEESEIGLLLSDYKIREKNLKKYIRECSFELLNKLCAIRLLEERNMIAPTVKKYKEYGDKSEVQKNLGQVSYSLLDRDPYDGMKFAIELTLRELSTQIKVMFDVNSEHSLLFPDSKTLREIIKVLLDEIPEEDWKRDDFIGWTYQYFVEDEKEEIEQADTPEEIAAKTQVYTYDWIIKYIVDNTLGAYWNEIISGQRPQQSVETIKLIDPSCGSGSFLVYAFDKFYEIYKDEGKVQEKDIPNYIISKNLYGLDIDERAVQLTALNLYIKAKERNRNMQIDKFNIICTDSRIKQEVNIDRYLYSLSIDPKLREVIKNIVHQAFNYMRENNVLGSLMKVEEVINPLIDEYIGGRRRLSIREVQSKKQKIRANEDQITLFSPEVEQLSLDTIDEIRYFESREEFVDYLRQKILDCVDYVVTKINKDNDINSRMFAKDLDRGSNFIGAMMQEYEIVVGNPPYLTNRKMGKGLKVLIDDKYPNSKYDLYSVFVECYLTYLTRGGFLGYIIPDTFLCLGSFNNYRYGLLKRYSLKELIHLGQVFKGYPTEVIVKIICNDISANNICTFIDLKENSNKENAMKNISIFKNKNYLQKDFLKIEDYMFMYWMSPNMLKTFTSYKKLEPNFAVVRQGLSTGDNNKFVLLRWEVKQELVGTKWYLFAKGGGSNKYYDEHKYIVFWENDGEEIKSLAKQKYGSETRTIKNQKFYFKRGISYSSIGGKVLSLRYMPSNWLFADKGSCIFVNDNENLLYILGLLNTKGMSYFAYSINPTVSFQVGDIKKIPMAISKYKEWISINTFSIICLKKYLYRFNVLSDLYSIDLLSDYIVKDAKENNLIDCITSSLFNFYLLYITIEELEYLNNEMGAEILNLNTNDKDEIIKIYQNSSVEYSLVKNEFKDYYLQLLDFVKQEDILEFNIQTDLLSDILGKSIKRIKELYKNNDCIEKEQSLIEDIKLMCGQKNVSIITIAQKLGIHPRSILSIMEKHNLVIEEDVKGIVKRYLQTLARKAFDENKDGIVLLPDMLDKIHDELSKTFKDRASSIETEINNIIGKDIEKWLIDEYAIDYVNNTGYDKKTDKYKEIKNPWEPLIWKGQSPKKNFTVFVWRYKITPDTELKIRSQYLENEIESYKMKVKEIDSQLVTADEKEKKMLEKERDEILNIVDDLNDYHKWITDNGIKLRGMWFNLE